MDDFDRRSKSSSSENLLDVQPRTRERRPSFTDIRPPRRESHIPFAPSGIKSLKKSVWKAVDKQTIMLITNCLILLVLLGLLYLLADLYSQYVRVGEQKATGDTEEAVLDT